MTSPDNGLAAVLVQVTRQAELLGRLDEREARNFRHAETTLAGTSAAVTGLRTTVDRQAKLLKSLDGLPEAVAELTAHVTALLPDDEAEGRGYKPPPSVHWWSLGREDRDRSVAHLRAWVEQVYRPHYGHLAVLLGPCWEDHPLCLVQLDWLSELHSALYFQPARTTALLSAQAEYGTRIIPAVSEQFRAETSRCGHRRAPAAADSPWAGNR